MSKAEDADPAEVTAAQTALVNLEEIGEVAERMLSAFEQPVEEREEVVWLERPEDWAAEPSRPASLHVAPLEVGEVLAENLFSDRTVVLTSATLTLGGSFAPLARQWGLDASAMGSEWEGMDVGSPFLHGRSGILYVAKHLPIPGRDGLPPEYLEEMWELIKAAGGRTLGLFSSMRAAKAAAAALRESLPYPVLCQGDDSTMQLVKEFAEDEPTCLFGTLSLWQGVDVPGPSLRLVIIDRIPFPGPTTRSPRPGPGRRTRAAAAGSWRCPPRTRRCCWPRGPGGCCARSTTGAWSPCSTRGWSPSGTASSCGPRCRRSGRRPTRRWCAAR